MDCLLYPGDSPRQEYWSRLPFPSPGDLPNPGIKPRSPHCRQTLYCLSHHSQHNLSNGGADGGMDPPCLQCCDCGQVPSLLKKFTYLPASCLSCGMQDFCCIIEDLSLQWVVSPVDTCWLICSIVCEVSAPQPGIEPTSPALQGGFFTGLPGSHFWETRLVFCKVATRGSKSKVPLDVWGSS